MFISELLEDDKIQNELLMRILSGFGISTEHCSSIFARWEGCSIKKIQIFSAFAYHCCKVKLLFDFALRYDLIGTRPTNLLDLQHLYYLPFSYIFTTNDKFQLKIAPYLIDEKQKIIDGSELKKDLKFLTEYCEILDDPKDIDRTKKELPQLPQSPACQLWTEYFDWPLKYKMKDNKTEEYYKEKMDEFISASKTERKEMLGKEPEFIVSEHFLGPTDFCICGSGKYFKDCCGKEVFDEHGKPKI